MYIPLCLQYILSGYTPTTNNMRQTFPPPFTRLWGEKGFSTVKCWDLWFIAQVNLFYAVTPDWEIHPNFTILGINNSPTTTSPWSLRKAWNTMSEINCLVLGVLNKKIEICVHTIFYLHLNKLKCISGFNVFNVIFLFRYQNFSFSNFLKVESYFEKPISRS